MWTGRFLESLVKCLFTTFSLCSDQMKPKTTQLTHTAPLFSCHLFIIHLCLIINQAKSNFTCSYFCVLQIKNDIMNAAIWQKLASFRADQSWADPGCDIRAVTLLLTSNQPEMSQLTQPPNPPDLWLTTREAPVRKPKITQKSAKT